MILCIQYKNCQINTTYCSHVHLTLLSHSTSRKDVGLPPDMQRSFAAEAEADREAKAKLISAEGEQRASRKLKEAADVMDESPATLQLRYLQTLNTISSENNHTYVFPLPLDLLGKLFGK